MKGARTGVKRGPIGNLAEKNELQIEVTGKTSFLT